MIQFIVDRCYDRYIITMYTEDIEEGSPLDIETSFIRNLMLTVADEYNQAGHFRHFRLSDDGEAIVIDLEAANGYEDMVAAAVDVITTAMTIMAEAHPDDVSVEA